MTSPTNIEREHEDSSHVVYDAVITEEKLATFKQGPVAPPTSEQILVCKAIAAILFNDEEVTTKHVLKIITALHQGVDNRLSAALESFIELIVKKVVHSLETIAHITEAVINDPGFFVQIVALDKLEQRKYTKKKATIKKPC